ncbi:translocation/assembly module TamB domain-containing protein [Hymenobacter profundi]|uniref:Translocation/assembly module TamB n=1 Tax=Hymenobacter profundi TaxID=1982110 RepID=A0ABS6X015_9BACT|nr:translocation/assembly module TamB [Hymenobacter profundi]MBW3129145.1 translocation/assembly module TamB [Hymenobacter profundi]
MPTFARRILYGILGLLAFVLLLIIGVVVALQFPGVQDFAANKAASYLQDKIGTEVRIGKFRTDFKHAISLDGVYLEDQKGDTLVSVGHLGVDLDLWALTKSEINLSSLELNDGTVHITRTEPDSAYNFDYITAAFATADTATTTPADTTGGFKYNIGDVRLTNIFLTYQDQVDGMNVRSRVGELAVNMEEVDVDKSIYRVGDAKLARAGFNIRQTKITPDTPSEPLTLTFDLNKVNLDTVSLVYQDDPSGQYINTKIGQAEVTADNIDLINSKVALNSLVLKNSTFAYAQNKDIPTEQRTINPAEVVRGLDSAVTKTTGDSTSWAVTLKKSDISGLDVKFDNFNEPKQKTRVPAMDYNHLDFTDLALQTNNLVYTENSTTGRINELKGKEQSGFQINHAEADVIFDSVQTRLDNLDLVTPNTRIRRTLAMGYESLGGIADDIANLKIEGDLRETRIGFRDILYLYPDIASTPPFTTGPDQSVLISGQVDGRVGDMRIRNLNFVGFRNTQVVGSGRIQGLPETDRRLYADFDVQKFTTTDADIRSLVPKGTIPAGYSLPPNIAASGTFKGRPTAMVFDTNLKVQTTYGNANAVVNMEAGPAGREPITARFAVQNFNVGKVLRDPTIGSVTATGRFNGRGLDPNTMVGRLVADVQRAGYQGYVYHDINAVVDIDRNKYDITARSEKDANLAFTLDGVVNLRDADNPAYSFNTNIKGANLTKLGFYTGGDLRVQGNLNFDLSGASANTINGTFSGTDVAIVLDNQPIVFDRLQGKIVQQPGNTSLNLDSNVLAVNLQGNTPLGDLATVLQEHIDRYFDLPGVRYQPGGPVRQFTFDASLLDTRIATNMVDGLTTLSPFKLTGSFDSRDADLTMNARVPVIVYTGYRMDSLRLNVSSDPQKLDYAVRLNQVTQDTSLRLPHPSLTGSIANNKVGTHLRIAEKDSTTKLDLAGALQVLEQGDAYSFSFDPKLVLNDQQWTVAPNNSIAYNVNSGAIRAENVNLSQGNQLIALQTLSGADYPLQARLQNLDLNMLATAGGLQDSLVGGTLNGEAVVRAIGQPRMAFTADANLNQFAYNKSVIGDVSLKATNPTTDRYEVDARLTGGPNNNDVRATGAYLASGTLDMNVNVTRLNLATAEPFAAGEIKDMSGYLTGQMSIAGTTSAPQIRGSLNTNDAGFRITQLGSPFTLPNESLVFDDRGIRFDNFTILDSLRNKAVVNGYVLTQNYIDDYRFQLRATTNDFIAVQSTAKDNELYYGKLVVDSDTRITGDLNLPRVRTTATVVDPSALTVVVPNDEAGKVESEGIVQFIDKSAPLDTMLARQVQVDSAQTAAGFDIAATITINDDTPFTIIIDPITGDNLRVQASGTLNTAIDPAGTITLSGALAVKEGQYHMSLYDLVERDFEIAEGSTIVWAGDPYNAQLNVSAIYNIKAAPSELLSSQGTNSDTDKNLARNTIPFRVFLNVKGEMLKPLIDFDIKLPENNSSPLRPQIENRLAQLRQPSETSELNKQVFSLLVLGRFMTDDPFQSTGGGSIVGDQLRGSASQVLTQQLNNLTGSYLSNLGVELGVDSQNQFDKAGNQSTRTDLNVAVRRQLLNNRLTVRLGTDVPLAGGNPASQGNQSVSNFGGDVSIEYNILANGRLRLRAYRNNAYGDIDGQYVRNGASLIFQRDYQNLADLFKGIDKDVKQESKQRRRQDKEEKKAAQDSTATRTAAAPARRDSTRTTTRRDSTRARTVARRDSTQR